MFESEVQLTPDDMDRIQHYLRTKLPLELVLEILRIMDEIGCWAAMTATLTRPPRRPPSIRLRSLIAKILKRQPREPAYSPEPQCFAFAFLSPPITPSFASNALFFLPRCRLPFPNSYSAYIKESQRWERKTRRRRRHPRWLVATPEQKTMGEHPVRMLVVEVAVFFAPGAQAQAQAQASWIYVDYGRRRMGVGPRAADRSFVACLEPGERRVGFDVGLQGFQVLELGEGRMVGAVGVSVMDERRADWVRGFEEGDTVSVSVRTVHPMLNGRVEAKVHVFVAA